MKQHNPDLAKMAVDRIQLRRYSLKERPNGKEYIKMCNIKMWENDGDSKRGRTESKWTPYRDEQVRCYISCRMHILCCSISE